MIKQILLLTKLEIKNLFNINVVLHTNNKKEKLKLVGFGIVCLLVSALILVYLGIFCYGMGYIGLAKVIPIYLYTCISIIIMFFSVFKATNTLFNHDSYEMLAALPVHKSSVVFSRFIGMYITDLLLSIVLMTLGMVIYNNFIPLDILTIIYTIIGTLFLPLLPLVLATIISLGLAIITSRLKYKSIVYTVLSFMVIGAFYASSMMLASNSDVVNTIQLVDVTNIVTNLITSVYFPASWFIDAVNGSVFYLGIIVLVPSILFIIMISIFSEYYDGICSLLKVKVKKQNYKFEELETKSPLKALVFKEAKRYFDCSIYVINTVTGLVMMLAIPILFNVAGVEEFGIYKDLIVSYYPLVIVIPALLMPTTCASISLEGKNWWLIKSLPIKQQDIYLSKIVFNLLVAAPFYLLTVILSIVLVPLSTINIIQVIFLPLIFIVLSSLVGLFINLKYPVFKWDNEAKVVKQGVSTLFTMLVDVIVVGICIAILYFIGYDLVDIGMTISGVIGIVGILLVWKLISNVDITNIN